MTKILQTSLITFSHYHLENWISEGQVSKPRPLASYNNIVIIIIVQLLCFGLLKLPALTLAVFMTSDVEIANMPKIQHAWLFRIISINGHGLGPLINQTNAICLLQLL